MVDLHDPSNVSVGKKEDQLSCDSNGLDEVRIISLQRKVHHSLGFMVKMYMSLRGLG